MKKYYIALLLSFVAIATTTAQNINIPDPNFEQALIDLNLDMPPIDGQVDMGMIAAIQTLDISGRGISDLTGIEGFVSLVELQASNNAFSAIDVSALSNLEILNLNGCPITSLNLNNNSQLRHLDVENGGNLATVDFINNTLLEFVNLNGNSLSGIAFSNLPNLQQLYLSNNNLTVLELSPLTGLTAFSASGNNLNFLSIKNGVNTNITSFEITNNPNLTCVSVDNAAYSTTNWTNIDAQTFFSDYNCRYTAIPDTNFESALDDLNLDDISGDGQVPTDLISGLTSLTVDSKNISDLTGIEDFTSLTTLNAQYNGINTVDLSKNTLLRVLRIRNNNLTAIDLSKNTDLRLMTLENNNLTSLDVSKNTLIGRFFVAGNNITSLDLRNNVVLVVVGVNDNNLSYINIKNGNHTRIQTFVAINNPNLTCVAVDDVAYSTANWTIDPQTSYSNVDCFYTSVPDSNFEAALSAYDNIPNDGQVPRVAIENITHLDVDNKNIADLTGIEDFAALKVLSAANNALETIDLSKNTALEALSLGSNTIKSIDLSNNTELTDLSIIKNDLTQLDLSKNTKLIGITVSENNLESLNVTNCTVLEEIAARDNQLMSIDLSTNVALSELHLENNLLANIDLSGNTNLYEVYLDDNDLERLELTTQTGLNGVFVSNNNLEFFDLRNGANNRTEDFNATGNSNLSCILVDDVTYSTSNWTQIDSQTSFSDTYCRYTAIPDTNFEAALHGLGYDNISGDGQVPTALIEGISVLDVTGKNISDLTGIEDFTALTHLSAGSNDITSIDVSNNVLLKGLSFHNNDITTIDLSANIALDNIELTNNRSLTAIDVRANVNLTSINISGTAIAALDIKNNPLLEFVNCSDNNITALYTDNNPVLEELEIEGNNITALDLSKNAALVILIANNNQLTTLDLSANASLEKVYLQNNSLSFLNMANGNNVGITNFNTTNNANLSCVLVNDAAYSTTNWTNIDNQTNFSDTYCRYTTIPDSNFEAALADLGYDDISGDGQVPTALIESVVSLSLTDDSLAMLVFSNITGIEDFTALENFTLFNIKLNTLDLSSNTKLKTVLIQDSEINNLILSNNPLLETLEFASVTEASSIDTLDFSNSPLLVKLDLSRIGLSNLILPEELPNLEELFLSRNNLASIDVSKFTALKEISLNYNSVLSYVNLKNSSNTNLSSVSLENVPGLSCVIVDDVAYSIANWTDIDNQISFSDTYCIYTSVPNVQFEVLLESLGYDDISRDGQVPTALIETITLLDLADQGITNIIGIEDFVGLTNLNLEGNDFETIDLSKNTFLESFNCNSCTSLQSINISGLNVLKELKLKDTKITEIDLDDFPLLETLNLRESEIAAIDVSKNINLKTLNIASTQIEFLDLSTNNGLTKLTAFEANLNYLNLKNTNIINVDVRGNPGLSCILIDDAAAVPDGWDYDNTVTFSDTYCRYTSIPDSNFEAALSLYDDVSGDGQVPTKLIEELTSLALNNKGITDPTGIEDFVALTTLELKENRFTAIDLSQNTQLENIDLEEVSVLESINLTGLTKLKNLNLNTNDSLLSIDLSDVESLEILNVSITGLSTLDLSNNPLLTTLRINNTGITTLDLSNNTALISINARSAGLTSLNLKNGNNTNITALDIKQNPNLYCVQVDNEVYADTNFTDKDDQTSFAEKCGSIEINLTVILEGAFELAGPTVMRNDLKVNNLLPTTSPYSDAAVFEGSFNSPITTSIVDWVEVQLRNPNDISEIVYKKSALLQRSGAVVDIGNFPPVILEAWRGNYYVAVAHRNHLTIVTSTARLLNGSGPFGTTIDLTNVSNILGGTNAVNDMGDGYYAMPAGDYEGNGQIQNADISSLIQQLGSSGYNNADMDMNGQVQNTDINNLVNPNIGKGEQF